MSKDIIHIEPSIRQAESIASHILLMVIRDLSIDEISKVHVTFEATPDIQKGRLDEIVEALASYNANQLLDLINYDIKEDDNLLD